MDQFPVSGRRVRLTTFAQLKDGEAQFKADDNLDFRRALGVTARIEHFRVEPESTSFTCTGAEDAMAALTDPDASGADGQGFHDV